MKKLLLICLMTFLALAALGCSSASGPASAKVKDPVCGMEVDPAKAVKVEREGKTYYFCSAYCKEQFEKDPAKYTQRK